MSEPTGAPDLFGDVDHPEWGPDVVWPIWIEMNILPGVIQPWIEVPSAWWFQPEVPHE